MTEAVVPASPGPSTLSDAEVEGSLARICASREFARSALHQRMLRYLVTQARAGASSTLREIVIGIEVFGRDPATFDTSTDPAVRVGARRLRERLARYYADEGGDDPLEFALPLGGYIPVIRRRRENTAPALPSIAVLPFRNLTGTDDREPFCDALADALIDALSRVPGVKVIARSSSFRFRGREDDIAAIGDALGVRLLFSGSVQEAGGKRRVTARLQDARDGSLSWSQIFDAGVEDVFAIQETIGYAVASTLTARLPELAGGTLTRPTSRDPVAQDLYERASYLARKVRPDVLAQAAAMVGELIALDPDYAPAYVLLAGIRYNQVSILAAAPETGLAQARAACERALALAPHSGAGHTFAGMIALHQEFDWVRAEAELRLGTMLEPGSARAHTCLCLVLLASGRFAEAEAAIQQAIALDPLSITFRTNLGIVQLLARRYAQAERTLAGVLEMEPGEISAALQLQLVWLSTGQAERALASVERVIAGTPDYAAAHLRRAEALACIGRHEEARACCADALVRFPGPGLSPYGMAAVHCRLGEADQAFARLAEAAERRVVSFVHVAIDPTFDSLHGDPRWNELLARHRLRPIDGATQDPVAHARPRPGATPGPGNAGGDSSA